MTYAVPPQGDNGPRAALRISKNVISSALPNFMDRDRATATIKMGGQETVLISQYCDSNMATIDQGLQRAVDYCRSRRIPLIMGADSNAHSTLWGPTQNQRGDDFEDFLHRNDLYVLNDGLKPTYYHWANGSRTKTYIDITVVNTFAINKNLGGEWTVSDEETLSDHKMITFLASASLEPPVWLGTSKMSTGHFLGLT